MAWGEMDVDLHRKENKKIIKAALVHPWGKIMESALIKQWATVFKSVNFGACKYTLLKCVTKDNKAAI